MLPEILWRLRRIHGRNRFVGKDHSSAGVRDTATNLVIVGQEGGDGFEAANFSHPRFCGSHRSAERKFDAFRPSGHQDAREKIARGSDCFEFGVKIVLRNSPVEGGYRADIGISQWRHHVAEILRAHAHVAVAESQNFVLGFTGQARQVVDFLIGAKLLSTNQQSDVALWIVRDQARYNRARQRRV